MEPGGITSITGDVGPGGVFLFSARVHKPGTRVRLVVRTPGGLADAHGIVRWARRVPGQLMAHARGGMGIEFTWISSNLRAYLTEIEAPVQLAV
jgi:hypothetical protein